MIELIIIIWIILVFLISAIPLDISVKLLGGKTNLIKTALIALVAGLVFSFLRGILTSFFGALLAFVVMIWIYREAFRLRLFKAFLAWILQFVFLALFFMVLALIGLKVIPWI
jgi:hypothetical protein